MTVRVLVCVHPLRKAQLSRHHKLTRSTQPVVQIFLVCGLLHVLQPSADDFVCLFAGFGPVLPAPSTPLETLRARWQSAAEVFCAQRGLAPSLLGVVVSELQHEGEELPAGVHKYKQVSAQLIIACSRQLQQQSAGCEHDGSDYNRCGCMSASH